MAQTVNDRCAVRLSRDGLRTIVQYLNGKGELLHEDYLDPYVLESDLRIRRRARELAQEMQP